MARVKITKWYKILPSKRRRGSCYIITHLPGVKGNANNAVSVVECWLNLFTDDIPEIIVKFTNQYIDAVNDEYSR